ncbi:uncharacterized protein LOC132759755 [Ruditapes philippinarum]|uniref:uncharacterized protein LOC132759755 n=1 Tax=Ruditapes philippinarum TaxID=129788 RepID=UPI00295C09A6|nr:uncharacterized protein LOC132759755 [Ruditapes philippinarum]
MESLLDEVDSLLTPGLSTDTPEWCSNCQSLKQEIKRLQDEQLQNFSKLKQKIISTDLLIKKYKSKCDDYDVQCKRTEEANKRADKSQRQCEILETQLKAALLDTEPLRKTKITLEAEIRLKNSEIQSMSDKLLAVESARKQYEHLSKANTLDIEKLEAEKKELMTKIKSREFGKLTKEAAKEYKNEITSLKRDKAAIAKNEKRLERQLAAAHTKIEHLTGVIKERKFSPKRRTRTTSGKLSSPLKSPTRSPRGLCPLTSPLRSPQYLSPQDHKLSPPQGHGRSQIMSEKKSESQVKDVMALKNDNELASQSSSSLEDTDDDDDNISVCSVKWTFSPLMKCLSPLPPSPACFAERKLENEEDEGEVSDIADVLEQQLLQDDSLDHISKDEIPVKVTENLTDLGDENSNTCIEDQAKGDETYSVTPLKEQDDHIKTVEAIRKVEIVNEEVKYCDNVKERVKEKFSAEENKDRELTLKEKLANSIEIISPTAVRKRVAHQSHLRSNQSNSLDSVNLDHNENNAIFKDASQGLEKVSEGINEPCGEDKNSDKIQKKPPVKRSARIYSQRESETEDQVSYINEYTENVVEQGNKDIFMSDVKTTAENNAGKVNSDGDKSELNRNDTEEFTPTFNENLFDCNTDSILRDMSKIKDSDNILDDERLIMSTSGDVVPSQDNKDNSRIKGNVSKTKPESDTSSPCELLSCDKEVDNEMLQDKQTAETILVPNSCLQKLDNVKKSIEKTKHNTEDKSAKVEIDKNCSKKIMKKFGSHKFINFQKSSSETLANEIDDYSYVGDYEVLDRNNKESKMFSPRVRGMQKKNVARRLRRSCKYRDLDSEVRGESKVEVNKLNHEQMNIPQKFEVLELRKKNSEGSCVIGTADGSDEDKLAPEGIVHDSNKAVTCKSVTIHKESSQKLLHNIDGDNKTDETKLVCSKEQNAEVSVEIRNDNSEICKGITKLETKEHSMGDSMFDDEFSNSDEKSGEGDNSVEKITTNRQMSTGFTVNTHTLERAPSTDSAVSFGTSPSRLFSTCGTIVEEELDDDLNKGDSESGSKISSDSNFIFGVEDLLNCKQEPSPGSQNFENAQNKTKPVCDTNLSSENCGYTLTKTKTCNEFTDNSLSAVSEDDISNKPGCSYQYHEPSFHFSRQEVNISADEKDSVDTARIPFISETLLHDDSSSRSSIQSITSIERASPVSPLSLSPFDFLNPISPLPPSPIREIERVSPLSPEHMTDEQKPQVDYNEPDVAINNEDDTPKNDENKKVECKGEFSDKIVNPSEIIDNEKAKDNHMVKNKREIRNKQPLTGSSSKTKSTTKLESVKKAKTNLECVNNVESQQCSPEQDTCLSDVSLKLFSIPQMISPVKTPKSCAKLKTEQIKSSQNITKLIISQKDKDKTTPMVLGEGKVGCVKGGPKQFVTEAPVTAIAVKPRGTRGRTSFDKTNIEMCIRKSSQTALKKVSSVVKSESSEARKVSGDNTVVAEETQTFKSVSGITSQKSQTLPHDEQSIESDRLAGNLEKLSERDAGLIESGDKESVVSIDEKGDNKVVEEYTLSHDNLAFKRKARVAHKPNILKSQKKIQIIDAPVLPPVTVSRKRKNLENNKDTHDKEKPKEGKVKKQKSSSSLKSISQENKKKMQSFLKSSETAECFVANYSPQPCDDTVTVDLLAACLECLGRVQTETLDVVYRMCENSQYLTIDCHLPFTSDVEKKAVELIQYICTELKYDWMDVMRKIWDCVFSCDSSRSIVGKMAQCRVFVALCSLQGDIEKNEDLILYHETIMKCS